MPELKYKHSNGKYAHREVAARALGKPLPKGAQVHHVDGNPSNNAPSNLVICPSKAYHFLLHRRERALDMCGDPDSIRCFYCNEYGADKQLSTRPAGYHYECLRKHNASRKARGYR